MKRFLYSDLLSWKSSKDRLPLILLGARQVGKTYLLEEFGKKEFKSFFNIDFEKNKDALIDLFGKGLDSKTIISKLSLHLGVDICPDTDLLIFDEVQNCPRALTALKYLHKDFPQLAICCAGSLLGLSLSEESFPVGSVSFLKLYPMSFAEFVLAIGGKRVAQALDEAATENLTLITHDMLWDFLTTYYVVGGMPKAVVAYQTTQNNSVQAFVNVREIQNNLILAYMNDINKHCGKVNAMHIARVFENIPKQLSANLDVSVKRYRFNDVLPGKRGYAQLEGPLQWLDKAGLIIKSPLCNRAEQPLITFTKENIFRLYLFDIGLLGALLDLNPNAIKNDAYGMKKGFYAENFIARELKTNRVENVIGWQESNAEIEFVLTTGIDIIPVEVKAGHRTQTKSLAQFIKKYQPKTAIKFSANLPQKRNIIHEWPLYLVGQWKKLVTSPSSPKSSPSHP